MKKNILLLETVAEEALQLLEENVRVFTAYGDTPLEEVLNKNQIQAIITRGKGQVNKKLMEACPELEVVARCGVGLDNVDVKEATLRGIKVINAPGSNAGTIAEHTLTIMLMLMRNMYHSVDKVKDGQWQWRNGYGGDELAGKTLGILGMGNIGKRVARLGEAFGMNVICWNRSTGHLPYQVSSMEDVLRRSDIVSIHLPLTEETVNIIGEKELSLMQPHALLINTARGGLIDQTTLLKALQGGKIGGFGADVLAEEPPANNDPILSLPNTLITPHVGSLTATTYRNMCVHTVRNVLAVLRGNQPELGCIFNRQALGI